MAQTFIQSDFLLQGEADESNGGILLITEQDRSDPMTYIIENLFGSVAN